LYIKESRLSDLHEKIYILNDYKTIGKLKIVLSPLPISDLPVIAFTGRPCLVYALFCTVFLFYFQTIEAARPIFLFQNGVPKQPYFPQGIARRVSRTPAQRATTLPALADQTLQVKYRREQSAALTI
jgi:hypothetical protein